MQLRDLPKDLLGETITYMSFKEVQSLCSTDKTIRRFCLGASNTDKRIWRELILNTYGDVDNIRSIIEDTFKCSGDECWNYITYTNLIKYLPEYTQGLIYLRMNDMESFNMLDSETINILAIVENRRDLILADESELEFLARSLTVPMLRRKLMGQVLPFLIKYPDLLERVLITNRSSISGTDIIGALNKATRDVELGEDRMKSIRLLQARL